MKPVKNNIDNYKDKKDNSLLFLTISVLALFIGLGSTIGFFAYTLIDFYSLSKFIIGFIVIGFIIPLKIYQKWFDFIKYEMIIFNVIGVGPFLTGLLLCINFLISSNPTTHKYRIEQLYVEGDNNTQSLGLILEGNAFSGEQKITGIDDINPNEILGKPFLKLTISKGLFGYDVIKEKEFVK